MIRVERAQFWLSLQWVSAFALGVWGMLIWALPHPATWVEQGVLCLIGVVTSVDQLNRWWRKAQKKQTPEGFQLGLEVASTLGVVPWGVFLGGWGALVGLLRVPLLWKRHAYWADRSMMPKGYRNSLVVLVVAGLIHSIGSVWMVLYPHDPLKESAWDAYVKAIYWTLTTVATIGYGDITPTTTLGRIFSIAVMVIGVGVFGVVVAQVTQLILVRDQRAEAVKGKLETLEAFLKHYEVPVNLRKEAMNVYHHQLQRTADEGEKKILSELPQALRRELETYMLVKPLSRVKLFEGCPPSVMHEVAHELEQVLVSPGQWLMKKGDQGREMYLILHGAIEILSDNQIIARLESGAYFGEMALIEETTRRADARAVGYCDLLRLDQVKFERLMKLSPKIRENVDAIIAQRRAEKK